MLHTFPARPVQAFARRGRSRLRWGTLALALWLSACAPLPTTTDDAADAGPATAVPGERAAHQARPARAPRGTAVTPGTQPSQPAPAAAAEAARDSDQQGMASWYGPGFHGRRTASGERFDREEFTAAHRSYAFGTRLCVRSAVTGKAVVVRVNDRGPFSRDRVIDLSQAAAEELGMVGLGIKPVEIWALGDGEQRCPVSVDDDGLLDDEGLLRDSARTPVRKTSVRKAGAKAPAKASAKPKSTSVRKSTGVGSTPKVQAGSR